MKLISVIMLLVCSHLQVVFGQVDFKIPGNKDLKKVVNSGSALQTSPLSGSINAHHITKDWDFNIKNYTSYQHTSIIPAESFSLMKAKVNQKRIEAAEISHENVVSKQLVTPAPFLGKNFRGNIKDNSVPMDNSMAISKNGFIVSGINSNVIFTGPDGKTTYSKGLADFFTLLGLSNRMYDPRVIYDVETNRFIFMCLHGSEPSNTFLCLAFSKTEDPNGEWNYYKVDGNPSGDNRWFDYPNIALSNKDMYIAGLMRDTPGDWQYSVVYQLDKNAGFEGKDLTWKYYNDLRDADGAPSFNLVPTPSGWDKLAGPGMYFVSNQPLGGNKYNLYFTTGSLEENPVLISMQTTGVETSLAPDGRQSGTANVLNTFDSRIWSAMYLDGTIHMGSHVNTPNGDVGLLYCRFQIDSFKVYADILTFAGRDLAFPSFTAFGKSASDSEVLVNYLFSGPDIFPSQQQRVCSGVRNEFDWSDAVTLKEGSGYVDVLSDNNERWGDYTTACRRFFDNRVESWVTGCFGESRSYGTWLGQYLRSDDVTNSVFAEFVADKTTTSKDNVITFTDLTPTPVTAYEWFFEGGNPEFSTAVQPTVQWSNNGAYDVRLIVQTALGIDTIIKKAYIHITDPVIKPVADFSFDKDTVYINDVVSFRNESSENAITYKWTFQQGTPSSSSDKNPVIKYSKLGSYLVSLTATNIAGSNTKIKQKAITVIPRQIPVAAFTSNKNNITAGDSVQFFSLSTGGPTALNWYFEGGEPAYSNAFNPVVTYAEKGEYDVTLIVENELGRDSLTIKKYILAGTSSNVEVSNKLQFKLYPNPVSDNTIKIEVNCPESGVYTVELFDNNGGFITHLYSDKIKAGFNLLSFNTFSLASGKYYVVIGDKRGHVYTLPFIVAK